MNRQFELVGANSFISFPLGIMDTIARGDKITIQNKDHCDHICSLSWGDKLGNRHPLFKEVVAEPKPRKRRARQEVK